MLKMKPTRLTRARVFWCPLLAGSICLSLHAQVLPQILILGTTHFDNPNHEIANMAVDDMLTPERQRQIDQLLEVLARFKPTRICIEVAPEHQAEFDQRYRDYLAGQYKLTSNERDQLGLRLAAKLKLAKLDAVDFKGDPPGPQEAYDFAGYAKVHGEEQQWKVFMDELQRYTADETLFLHTHTLIDWFRHANTPKHRLADNSVYFKLVRLDGSEEHPAAAWVGGWHARNMIIIENVRRLAKPSDRVLVIFGKGHSYLLDAFARQSGAFDVVDTERYLAQ